MVCYCNWTELIMMSIMLVCSPIASDNAVLAIALRSSAEYYSATAEVSECICTVAKWNLLCYSASLLTTLYSMITNCCVVYH